MSENEREKENVTLSSQSLKSASSLMALQLFSRLVTFALNQALVRLASPIAYGTVSIQLELLLSTILFLSREGFRNALLRANTGAKTQESKYLSYNISLLPVYLGSFVTILTSVLYIQSASDETSSQPYFQLTVILYAVAALFELMCEPMHIMTMQSVEPLVRVKAEGSAFVVKSITTVLLLQAASSNKLSLLAFGLGQLAFSITMLSLYLKEMWNEITFTFHRTSVSNATKSRYLPSVLRPYFDENLLEVSVAMTGQGVLKHLLTEGDKIIISHVSPLKDQGGYAIANNYGALIARVFFQPIEETSRLYFSKTLTNDEDSRDIAMGLAISRLSTILRIYNLFGLLILNLAPSFLSIIVAVLLPARYAETNAAAILSAWIWYIPVLATNGILEAFVSSAATTQELATQSKWMVGASVAYLSLAMFLYKIEGLGDAAIVYANIVNLAARAIYCSHFIRRLASRKVGGTQHEFSWRATVPSLPITISCLLGGLLARYSNSRLEIDELAINLGRRALFTSTIGLHLGIGFLSVIFISIVCIATEATSTELKKLFTILSKKKAD